MHSDPPARLSYKPMPNGRKARRAGEASTEISTIIIFRNRLSNNVEVARTDQKDCNTINDIN